MLIIYHPLSLKAKAKWRERERTKRQRGLNDWRMEERDGRKVTSIRVLDYVEGHDMEVKPNHLFQSSRMIG